MNRTRNRLRRLLLCVVLLFSLCGCTVKSTLPHDDGKIKVAATLFPQYSFAKAIAGDRAEVELILPPGTDSHAFDPSMSELLKVKDADLFLYTGDKMETWASSFIRNADESMTVVDLSEGIPILSLHDDEDDGEHEHEHDHAHHHGHELNIDPHIFTSPVNAIHMAQAICAALCKLDPDGEETYTENAEALYASLSSLDERFRTLAREADGKTLYFGGKFSLLYFVHEYGFSYMSLYDSCAEGSEPSVRRMSEIIEAMKRDRAKVIFYPELSDPKAAESIAECTDAEALLFHSCHNLSARDFKDGKTYVDFMTQNYENLKEALS